MITSTLNGFSRLALILTAVVVSTTACGNPSFAPEAGLPSPQKNSSSAPGFVLPSQKIEMFQQRYKLNDTHQKLVDDHGDGFAPLYGVRNFRAVLNGVVYRGGANNTYNKFGKRSNMNPLPDVGLKNLCKEGFGTAVYLYPDNFATASKSTSCQTADGQASKLTYVHFTPFSDADVTSIFSKVQTALTHPETGPLYLHCWNGWHASGLASALILRQFCGMDPETAVTYWNLNTDGNAADARFGNIRARIRNFVVKPGYTISEALRRQVCPRTAL